jgi:hypothetical protein
MKDKRFAPCPPPARTARYKAVLVHKNIGTSRAVVKSEENQQVIQKKKQYMDKR